MKKMEIINIIKELIHEVDRYEGDLAEHLCKEDYERREEEFNKTDEVLNKAYVLINELQHCGTEEW